MKRLGLARERKNRAERSDAGDTLFEVLVAMSIIAITAVAVLGCFVSAIGATAEETHVSEIGTLLKSYAEVATADLQENLNSAGTDTNYISCGTYANYASYLTGLPTAPTDYSFSTPTIQYWNGSAWENSCTTGSTEPQLFTFKVTYLLGTSTLSQSLSFAVSDLNFVAPTDTAPSFSDSSPYPYTVGQGESWTFTVTTSGSPAPAITDNSLPTGVTFVDNGNGTGTLTGSGSTPVGSYTITFTANNSVGTAATLAFDLVVASSPVFTTPYTASFEEGATISYTVYATDTDSKSPSIALETTLSGALKNLKPNDNGNGSFTLSGTLVAGVPGVYSLVFEATNSVGVSANQTYTVYVPSAPGFLSSFPAQTWEEGSTVNFEVSATDTYDSAEPALSVTSPLDGALSNLTFTDNDDGTGELTGTLVAGETGTETVTFQAKNSAGQTTTVNLSVNVIGAPVFTDSGSATLKAGATGVNLAIGASAAGTTISSITMSSISGDAAIKNLVFSDSGGTATLTGNLVAATDGEYTITFTATNAQGYQTQQAYYVYVPSTPVIVSAAASAATGHTYSESAPLTIATATDTNDPDVPSYVIASCDLPSTGSLDAMTCVDEGNGDLGIYGKVGTTNLSYSFDVTAENSAGVTATQLVTVYVPTTPVITSSGASAIEGHTYTSASPLMIATATDADDSAKPSYNMTICNDDLPNTGPLDNMTCVDEGNGDLGIYGTVGSTPATDTFSVTADNSAGTADAANVTVYVPSSPIFTVTSGSLIARHTYSSSAPVIIATSTDSNDPNVQPTYPTGDFPSLSADTSIKNMTLKDDGNGDLEIYGTVGTTPAKYTVTVTAENSAGTTTSMTVTIYIPSTPTFTLTSTTTIILNHTYASTAPYTIATANDSDDPGYPSYIIADCDVPTTGSLDGMTCIDEGNGSLGLYGKTGSTATTYTFDVTVENSAGTTVTQLISVRT